MKLRFLEVTMLGNTVYEIGQEVELSDAAGNELQNAGLAIDVAEISAQTKAEAESQPKAEAKAEAKADAQAEAQVKPKNPAKPKAT